MLNNMCFIINVCAWSDMLKTTTTQEKRSEIREEIKIPKKKDFLWLSKEIKIIKMLLLLLL